MTELASVVTLLNPDGSMKTKEDLQKQIYDGMMYYASDKSFNVANWTLAGNIALKTIREYKAKRH